MRQIDQKYQTTGEIQKLDGTPIPDDEPLMLFRGKDSILPALLEQYLKLCQEAGSPPEHLNGIRQHSEELRAWQAAHPDRVRRPD